VLDFQTLDVLHAREDVAQVLALHRLLAADEGFARDESGKMALHAAARADARERRQHDARVAHVAEIVEPLARRDAEDVGEILFMPGDVLRQRGGDQVVQRGVLRLVELLDRVIFHQRAPLGWAGRRLRPPGRRAAWAFWVPPLSAPPWVPA